MDPGFIGHSQGFAVHQGSILDPKTGGLGCPYALYRRYILYTRVTGSEKDCKHLVNHPPDTFFGVIFGVFFGFLTHFYAKIGHFDGTGIRGGKNP